MDYHILNGDLLLERFPVQISGERIVARECLIDGTVKGDGLEELFSNRAQFLQINYGIDKTDYHDKTVSEFEKLKSIQEESNINLWFEEDLFCQVNMWFIIHLLKEYEISADVYIVCPKDSLRHGFSGLNNEQLEQIYNHRIMIADQELESFIQLWKLFQQHNLSEMETVVERLNAKFSFIRPAYNAYVESIPNSSSLGRPMDSLLEIIKEKQTTEFNKIFPEFCNRNYIYGFGDLQVKRFLSEVLQNHYH